VPGDIDPVVARRQLGRELKRIRQKADLTQQAVASLLDWSASKVIRIENGAVAVQPTDVRALLAAALVTDKVEIDRLVLLARSSKKLEWSEDREVFSQAYGNYLRYEASAAMVRQFNPSLVPGLLQCEEYAFCIAEQVLGMARERAERLVEARLRRQELLTTLDGPNFRFILDETALMRPVGGTQLMERQLNQLYALSQHDRVDIRVLPLAAGAHLGMRGPFILLEFEDENFDDVLFLEDPMGDSFTRDDKITLAEYYETFATLESLSATLDERVLQAVINWWNHSGGT
jgi:transcriptional regulator with XRE-family HTH domain